MKYMGSKAKVARYIVPIIQKQIERSGYETYLEPFCGGCNVIDKIEAPQRIASDCNKYLIALMQHIQAGGELPGYIEREEYAKVRANRDDYPEWYAGYVGFVASYNGRFFDGGYSGKTQTTGGLRDYQDEGRRNIEAQRRKAARLKKRQETIGKYDDFERVASLNSLYEAAREHTDGSEAIKCGNLEKNFLRPYYER